MTIGSAHRCCCRVRHSVYLYIYTQFVYIDIGNQSSDTLDFCACGSACVRPFASLLPYFYGNQQSYFPYQVWAEKIRRFRFGPLSLLTCSKDIANATGWRHFGVNTEPNLNFANPLALWSSSGILSNYILGNCMPG